MVDAAIFLDDETTLDELADLFVYFGWLYDIASKEVEFVFERFLLLLIEFFLGSLVCFLGT